MPEIHAARRGRAREMIAGAGADAALITSGPNVRYLTGLASSNAALLLAADGAAVLATDSRYTLAAQRDCPDVELITERFIEPRLAAEMAGRAFRTVAFEAHEMTVERHAELAAKAGDVKVMPFGRKIEELRAVKDPSEIELLGTACRISCQAIADVFSLIRPGLTERGLAAAAGRQDGRAWRRAARLRHHRGQRPERRDPAPRPDRPAAAPRRPDHDRLRRAVRRLPRRHDPYRRIGRAAAGSGRSTSWSRPPSGPAWTPPGRAPTSATWTRPPAT